MSSSFLSVLKCMYVKEHASDKISRGEDCPVNALNYSVGARDRI